MGKGDGAPMRRALLRNFCYIFLCFLAVMFALALFTYSSTRAALEGELMNSTADIAAGYAAQMDDFFIGLNRLNATLSINQLINSYIASPQASPGIFEGLHESIRSQLETAIYSLDYVDSIYIVSEADDSYISKSGYQPLSMLLDQNWLSMLPEDMQPGKPVRLYRKVADLYPYVLSYVTRVNSGKNAGYIVVNANIKYFPALTEQNRIQALSSYIITQDEQILYRTMKRDLLEPLAVVPELSAFAAEENQITRLVRGDAPYVYSQVYSPEHQLYFVTVAHLTQYTQSLSMQRRTLAAFSCALLVFFAMVAVFLCLRAQKPIKALLALLENPQKLAYQADYSPLEVKQIAEHFVRYIQANTALSQELQQQMQVMSDVRLWALQSQINPHFIFNTLNLIHCECVKTMGYTNPASDLILKFSKLIHYALYSNHLVPLSQELTYTRVFADILARRYGDSVQLDFAIPDDCLEASVPKLLLQPLIENATQHGADFSSGKTLHIVIRAETHAAADGEELVFTVEDDGVGIAPEALEELRQKIASANGQGKNGKNGIGLSNVVARLKLLFPRRASLTIDSRVEEGTRVTLHMPYIVQEE